MPGRVSRFGEHEIGTVDISLVVCVQIWGTWIGTEIISYQNVSGKSVWELVFYIYGRKVQL